MPGSYYDAQIRTLRQTYDAIRSSDMHDLTRVLTVCRRRNAVYVGSGGALAVALLAADLHGALSQTSARTYTPLDLMSLPWAEGSAFVLFSASARHPDALAALGAARRGGANPVVLVTQRPLEELPRPFLRDDVAVISVPGGRTREGFLATNSVLALAAASVMASGWPLPRTLRHLTANHAQPLREHTIILHGARTRAVATDLETRLSETGLSAAQVTDYRNFAHGRHTGLARRLTQTSIVALLSADVESLAERTLETLPRETHIVRLSSSLAWPLSTLDLLVASMKVVAATAEKADMDPSRPKVPEFGRRLYRLSANQYLPPPTDPIVRKLAAAQLPSTSLLYRDYARALDSWLRDARRRSFDALVLDYDGTVCATHERYSPPLPGVREAILRLLRLGVRVGVASGRGESLYASLRSWVPEDHWDSIQLGLYNGGVLLRLSDRFTRPRARDEDLVEAERRLRSALVDRLGVMKRGMYQLRLDIADTSPVPAGALAQMASEVLAREPSLQVKVVASAHSVDLVPAATAKTAVLDLVRETAGTDSVLVVGDQGQVGGNDFELLAASRWSLSVDRVSSDPSRCWNLSDSTLSGPHLLEKYLRAVAGQGHHRRFEWRRPVERRE